MKKVLFVLFVAVLACSIGASVSDAKGKKGKKGKNKPAAAQQATPAADQPAVLTVEESFAHMNPNSGGMVNEEGVIAFVKSQNPVKPAAEAEAEGKALYAKIIAFAKGDAAKGFNLETYKSFKAANP